MASSHVDFETRKSVHINLTRETHAALRMATFKHHLSMQEIFEEVARQVVEEQSYMMNLLVSLAERKRTKATEGFSSTDAESIFRAIEGQNPLKSQGD